MKHTITVVQDDLVAIPILSIFFPPIFGSSCEYHTHCQSENSFFFVNDDVGHPMKLTIQFRVFKKLRS